MKKYLILLLCLCTIGYVHAQDANAGKSIKIPTANKKPAVSNHLDAIPYYYLSDDIKFTKINFATVEVNANPSDYCAHVWFTVPEQLTADRIFWIAVSSPLRGNLQSWAVYNKDLTAISRKSTRFVLDNDVYELLSQYTEDIKPGRYMLHLKFVNEPHINDLEVCLGSSTFEDYTRIANYFAETAEGYISGNE